MFSGFRFRVSGFRFQVSGFGFRVSGFGLGVSGFGFRVSGVGLRVSGFGFRVSGFGFRVSGFGLRVSGFGCRHLYFCDKARGVSPSGVFASLHFTGMFKFLPGVSVCVFKAHRLCVSLNRVWGKGLSGRYKADPVLERENFYCTYDVGP